MLSVPGDVGCPLDHREHRVPELTLLRQPCALVDVEFLTRAGDPRALRLVEAGKHGDVANSGGLHEQRR